MNLTAWLLIAVTVLLVGWDIYAAFKWGYDGTISRDILTASKNHPVIAFAIGVIAGHLFWPQ